MTDQEASSAAVAQPTMAEPAPIALGLFGLTLAAVGIRFFNVTPATLAASSTNEFLNYAILAGGFAEGIAGFFCIVRGGTSAYIGWITATFGIWLVVGFFLLTHMDPVSAAAAVPHGLTGAEKEAATGAITAAFHANSVAWYVLFLIVPVGVYAIVSFTTKNVVLMIAFVAIEILLLLLGLAFHDVFVQLFSAGTKGTAPDFGTAVILLRITGYLSFISAACLWWLQGKEVFTLTGLIKAE